MIPDIGDQQCENYACLPQVIGGEVSRARLRERDLRKSPAVPLNWRNAAGIGGGERS